MSNIYTWGGTQQSSPIDWGVHNHDLAMATATLDVSAAVADEFETFADEWIAETAAQSSLTKRYAHPAYQRIVGMGPAVVPLLLAKLLEADPDYWFHALRSITGADPVTASIRGNLRAMADAWLAWGRNQGYQI